MLTLHPAPTSGLAAQILDTFPSGSYALTGLLRLLDITETHSVPTAAVECCVQPRLLINPTFVAQHAATPEKLMMLVMHELHHVLLGHTTLFPRISPVQNFVFDAVINGILCRMFSEPAYTSFLSDYYQANSFPQCLLRPPPGWPGHTSMDYLKALKITRLQKLQIHEVHLALYSDVGASYFEVYKLLPELLTLIALSADGKDGFAGIPLLGEHSHSDPAHPLEQRSPVLFDLVREVVEQWPQPPDPIRGRSLDDVLKPTSVNAKRVPNNRVILRGLIRKVAGQKGAGRHRSLQDNLLLTFTPLPCWSRRGVVMRALGVHPLLHPQQVPWQRVVPQGERVRVYIDVSGSMARVLPALYGAVLDCSAWVFPTVHLFSTQIVDVSWAQMRAGYSQSTGGTDIACVAQHMAEHRVKRALIITDGWVGTPQGEHLRILAKTQLAVAYLGSNVNQGDLSAVANHTTILGLGAKA